LFIGAVSGGGPSVWASAKTLRRALDLIASATIEKELKDSAQALAEVVTMISVSALAAAIAHEASKRSSKWGARKPSVRKPPEQRAP
jgi:diphthamide synthase (EF-2-diphthine--ammonia ligase)